MPDTQRKESPMSTTDIARVDDSSIELLPPARNQNQTALAVLRENAEALDLAYSYAQSVCGTRVCPARFFQKPEDGAAAIMYGLEIGLSPSAALQKVVVIHGMPSLEARTMVALLKPRGYKVRTLEQSDERVTVEGIDPAGDRYISQWTIERATKAGYVPTIDERTGKYKTNSNNKLIGNEKYLTDPQAMLKAKAQAEVCRDMAPDVLLGISYSREELESERWDEPAPVRRAPVNEPVTVDEILGDEPEPEPKTRKARKPKTEKNEERAEAVEKAKEQLTDETLDAEEAADSPPPPAPAAEPTPDGDVAMASDEQLKKLGGLLAMDGFDDTEEGKAARLAWCQEAIKRPLQSARDLTSTEVENLIEILDQAPREAETEGD